MKQLYSMGTALETLNDKGKEKLSKLMILSKITLEDIDEVNLFISHHLSPESFAEKVEGYALLSYIQAFNKVKELMEIAKGYEEMGEINLGIAEEMRHLEDEVEGGELFDEMDKKES